MTREEFMDIVYSELHSDGDNYRANRIIDAADEYAEDQSRWISCKDRLPEDNIKVLVSTKTAVGFASHDDIGWYIRDGYIDGIIAWMPLPEPYQPKEDEK